MESAEKSVKQVKASLEELEGNSMERRHGLSLEGMEEALRAKDKEITKMKAAEKAKVSFAAHGFIFLGT